MNNIPFFEEGAEYDNAKQKFANWNNICCGCCHRHNAVLPEHDRRIIVFHKTCTTYWLHIIRKRDMQEKTNRRIWPYLMRWCCTKGEGRVQVQDSCRLNRYRWMMSKNDGSLTATYSYCPCSLVCFGEIYQSLCLKAGAQRTPSFLALALKL